MFEEDLEEQHKKRKKFNIVYNNDENIGFGKGYYIIYENYEGQPTFDCKYGVLEYNENVDMVSVGIINKIYYMYDMGWELDIYYGKDLKKIF